MASLVTSQWHVKKEEVETTEIHRGSRTTDQAIKEDILEIEMETGTTMEEEEATKVNFLLIATIVEKEDTS